MTMETHAMTNTALKNIASQCELQQFLKAIQLHFIEKVDPEDSGLLDSLWETGVLTETDCESLSGKHIRYRKDKARKTWFLLNKLSPDHFMADVAPRLLKAYPHIIPATYLRDSQESASVPAGDCPEQCLRHEMTRRVRLISVADVLFHHDCLSQQEYREIMECGDHPYPEEAAGACWARLLESLRRPGHAEDLENQAAQTKKAAEGLRGVLDRYRIRAPHDLPQLLSQGLPCTCSGTEESVAEPVPSAPTPAQAPVPVCLPTVHPSPVLQHRKVQEWMRGSPFGSSSTRSSGTSHCPNSVYSGRTTSSGLTTVVTHGSGSPAYPPGLQPAPAPVYHSLHGYQPQYDRPSLAYTTSRSQVATDPRPIVWSGGGQVGLAAVAQDSSTVARSAIGHYSAETYPSSLLTRMCDGSLSRTIDCKSRGVRKYLAAHWLSALCVAMLLIATVGFVYHRWTTPEAAPACRTIIVIDMHNASAVERLATLLARVNDSSLAEFKITELLPGIPSRSENVSNFDNNTRAIT